MYSLTFLNWALQQQQKKIKNQLFPDSQITNDKK